jgi:ferric-dicitrate binding protein FerR (iron transport regulator)
MALSRDEQRLLEQMEAALAAEDPKLAKTLRGTSRGWNRRRVAVAGLGFLVGLTCLITGMQVHPALSVLGFVIMLGAALAVVTGLQSDISADKHDSRGGGGGAGHDFLSDLEDRWRKNRDEGQ